MDVTASDYTITLGGDWSNTSLDPDPFRERSSNVTFDGSLLQTLTSTGGETFNNLTINNTGSEIAFNDNVIVSNTLNMNLGDINVATHKLTLGTGTGNEGTLSYTSGIIIGKFERWVNSTGTDIVFPVGTSGFNNSATINFSNLSGGSLITEFIPSDPLSEGLPQSENGKIISNQFSDGYWDFTAANGLASTGYNIDLDANGFTSYSISPSTRVIKRTNGGNWELDGTHSDAVSPTIHRTNLTGGVSTSGTQFGIGFAVNSITIDRVLAQVSCNGGNDGAINITVSRWLTRLYIFMESWSDDRGYKWFKCRFIYSNDYRYRLQ